LELPLESEASESAIRRVIHFADEGEWAILDERQGRKDIGVARVGVEREVEGGGWGDRRDRWRETASGSENGARRTCLRNWKLKWRLLRCIAATFSAATRYDTAA
jgi:hypothetical protein